MMFYFFRSYGFIDIHCYLNALIISLETITTVGYTVSDISFSYSIFIFQTSRRQPCCFCSLVL